MIVRQKILDTFETYHEIFGYSPENSLFFDIETTGFSPSSAMVFLIGAIGWEKDVQRWQLTQYLAENPGDEPAVLEAFFQTAGRFSTLIHFNGATFDLPFLKARARTHHIEHSLDSMASLDLYRSIRPIGKLYSLEHMNQTSLEQFLGWKRSDRLGGKDMAALFPQYASTKNPETGEALLLHNHDDMLGMTLLLSFAPWLSLLDGAFSSIIYAGLRENVLVLQLSLDVPVPVPLTLGPSAGSLSGEPSFSGMLLQAEGRTVILRIPLKQGTLLHFFADYKNYYYLPLEDMAIHKSVAAYVDKTYREQAKASNCYIKKSGVFLPQPEVLFTPAFGTSREAPESYFEYTEAFLSDGERLKTYAAALLKHITAQ